MTGQPEANHLTSGLPAIRKLFENKGCESFLASRQFRTIEIFGSSAVLRRGTLSAGVSNAMAMMRGLGK